MLACHKLNPAGGLGATTAMHDAVSLANWINVLPSLDVLAVEKIFNEYYLERYPAAINAYEGTQMFSISNQKVRLKTVNKNNNKKCDETSLCISQSRAKHPSSSPLTRILRRLSHSGRD